MCFAIGTALSVASAAASAAGTLMSAAGQSASYKAQSQYAARQSIMEQQKGAYEASRLKDQTTRQIDDMRSQYLSSGIALEGSALEVIDDSAVSASLDEQAIKYSAQVRSDNLKFESKLAKANAKSAMAGGVIGALAPIINAGSNMFQNKQNRTMISNPYLQGA